MTTGIFDHQDALYYFGDPDERYSDKYWKVQATTLEGAIKRFQVGGLFPYKYVKKEFRIMREFPDDGHYHSEEIIGAKPGAYIPIYGKVKDGDRPTFVYNLPYEQTQLDTRSLYSLPTNLLEGETSTALQVNKGSEDLERREVESELQGIHDQLKDLELLKSELEARAALLKKDVADKLKQIWIIELYIGSKEEIVQLSNGTPADAEEPITVFQQILCMDEEIAFYNWLNRKEQDFDFQDIKDFDNWLLESPEHLQQVIPAKKGIVGLRPRRKDKNYEGDDLWSIWRNSNLNIQNKKTYILIKNGENLYRIWADTQLWPRFFPLREEFDIKEKEHRWPSDEEKQKAKVEEYLRGLIVIQGLIDRSQVFSPLPAHVNVMKPEDVEKHFVLVRNDEPALTDGTELLGWEAYRDWLRKQVRVGCRIILTGTCTKKEYQQYHLDYAYWNYPGGSGFYPKVGEIFVIDREEEEKNHNPRWSFLYTPKETIWVGWSADEESSYRLRKKRVRWYCWESEAIALDAVSPKYIEYLLHNRYERTQYSEYFPLFLSWSNQKIKEEEQELPFVELVLTQAGVNPRDPKNEKEISRVKRLVRWWKLKTKYTRTLESDEPKALRMVKAAYLAGKDFEDDPEHLLEKTRKKNNETN